MNKLTPMMQQYPEIKSQYPDALLLYRMGDFYELFMDDSVVAARVCEIALTTRDRNAENPIPMCGVPYHSAEGYIAKLVAAGHKVAICDQVEDPRMAKGLVRREVTRVITPGLILESRNLTANQPNYLSAVASSSRNAHFGLAYLDVSTAEFRVVELTSEETLLEELLRVAPKELLLAEGTEASWLKQLKQSLDVTLTSLAPDCFDGRLARERLVEHFQVHSLEGFGIQEMDLAIEAAGAILAYMKTNLLGACGHIKKLLPYSRSDYMTLDEATVRNLEIFQSSSFQGRKGSLLSVVDRTRTAMGGRKLQQWLRYPLLDLERITARRQAVEEMVEHASIRTDILNQLEKINDIERLNGRNSTSLSTPRDLVALKKSLQVLPAIRRALEIWLQEAEIRHPEMGIAPAAIAHPGPGSPAPEQAAPSPGKPPFPQSGLLPELLQSWDDLRDVSDRIEATLTDPPPLGLNAGGVICSGVNPDLDHYARLSRDARSWMAEYEALERRRTSISSLKVRYNKVFGYYIEISKANLAAAPAHYMRKQTLVNAERYITEELKDFETQVLEADEKRLELEARVFAELRQAVALESGRIQGMAKSVALMDCLASLAETAALNDYCRPILDRSDTIHIRDGRHPVIERFLPEGTFVPNDLHMNQDDQQVLIITGPNMAGKSTILRQAALIVLLAQIGSFVPAAEARIGLVDRIFTRVGASDDLARGRSTFMVEMQEAANILHQATPKSLIILDEIGRGTSTFDGLSIAWAVAEHLHDFQGAGIKTLFATHYHELTELSATRPRMKNFNVAIKEWNNEILFFHKFVPGGTNRSYGIQVARLAGLPREVTDRAREILAHLEQGESPFSRKASGGKKRSRPVQDREAGVQLSLFRPSLDWLKDQILALDLDSVTPLSALQMLYALKDQVKRRDQGEKSRKAVVEPKPGADPGIEETMAPGGPAASKP
jgi:DNA mismatch repair protein MutS